MLHSLQAGRALAALSVVFFHLSVAWGRPNYAGFSLGSEFTALGYLGVDFFFALSGFIIFFAHHGDIGRPAALKDYFLKRFIRIYPLYWMVTLVLLAGAIGTQGTTRRPDTLADLASMVGLVHFNDFAPPLAPAWTLYHELFFYSLMGLVIWRKTYGVVALACWGMALAVFGIDGVPRGGSFVRMLTLPVNFSFFGGIGAFFIYRHSDRRSAACWLLGGCLLAVVMLALVDPAVFVAPFKAGLAVAFMCLLGGLAGLERSGVDMHFSVLTAVGNASFMLYLTHENIQSWLLRFSFRWFPVYARDNGWIVYLAIVAVCIACALLAYQWLEKPLIRALRKRLLGRRRPPYPAPHAMTGP